MPQTTITRKTSQRTRKDSFRRSSTTRPGRTAVRRTDKATAEVLAGSIYSLTLKPIPGIAIKKGIPMKESDRKIAKGSESKYEVMYQDLRLAFIRALKLTTGETTQMKLLESGMSLSASLHMIVNAFKSNILPEGFYVNVDGNIDDGYHFTIYKDVDFQQFWHHFPIQPVVRHLEKKDKTLLKLFIMTLSGLRTIAGFPTWFGGNMWAYDMVIHDEWTMIDMIEGRCESEEEVEAELQAWKEQVQCYKTGEAAKYMKLICSTSYDRDKIVSALGSKKRRNPIECWILNAVDLIDRGQTLSNFDYYSENVDDYTDSPISLYQQVTILWSDDDLAFAYECEAVDNEAANFGAQIPVLHYPINKNTKRIPFDEFPDAEKWMERITTLFDQYKDVYNYVKH